MKALTQTFLAGVAGALTIGVLIAAAGPLGLRDDGIQFPDGSFQTTAAAAFGLDDAANQSVNTQCLAIGSPSSDSLLVDCSDPVPPGQILVVEHLSAYVALVDTNCDARAFFRSDDTGPSEIHALRLFTEAVSHGHLWLVADTPIRAYFTHPEQPFLQIWRSCVSSDWYAQLFLSGYLVEGQA